jgi:hypothetical protein
MARQIARSRAAQLWLSIGRGLRRVCALGQRRDGASLLLYRVHELPDVAIESALVEETPLTESMLPWWNVLTGILLLIGLSFYYLVLTALMVGYFAMRLSSRHFNLNLN